MSLFTDLIAETKSHAKGHENLTAEKRNKFLEGSKEHITEAYNKLSVEERGQFLEEAKDYIRDHNLKANVAHPRFNAAVFVYQAAVQAEVDDISRRKDSSPEAAAIIASPTYKAFENFKSKLDNHSHPDGLYGPVTHAIQSDPKYMEMFENIRKSNEKAHEKQPEPVVVKQEKPPEKKPEPAPEKPVEVKPEQKKAEPNVYVKQTESFGKGDHTYNGPISQQGANGPDYTFSSPSKATVRTSETAAGMIFHPNDKKDVTITAGVVQSKTTLKDTDNNVNISKHVSNQPDGTPNFQQLSGATPTAENFSKVNFTGLQGGIQKSFNQDGAIKPYVGAELGVGFMKSSISTTSLQNSGVDLNNSFNNIPLPGSSQKTGLGVKGAVIGGAAFGNIIDVEGKYGVTHGANSTIQTVDLGIKKTVNLTNDGGVKLTGYLGAQTTGVNINHDANKTITTTTPGGPPINGIPQEGSTKSIMVSQHNGSNTPLNLKNMGITGGVTVTADFDKVVNGIGSIFGGGKNGPGR